MTIEDSQYDHRSCRRRRRDTYVERRPDFIPPTRHYFRDSNHNSDYPEVSFSTSALFSAGPRAYGDTYYESNSKLNNDVYQGTSDSHYDYEKPQRLPLEELPDFRLLTDDYSRGDSYGPYYPQEHKSSSYRTNEYNHNSYYESDYTASPEIFDTYDGKPKSHFHSGYSQNPYTKSTDKRNFNYESPIEIHHLDPVRIETPMNDLSIPHEIDIKYSDFTLPSSKNNYQSQYDYDYTTERVTTRSITPKSPHRFVRPETLNTIHSGEEKRVHDSFNINHHVNLFEPPQIEGAILISKPKEYTNSSYFVNTPDQPPKRSISHGNNRTSLYKSHNSVQVSNSKMPNLLSSTSKPLSKSRVTTRRVNKLNFPKFRSKARQKSKLRKAPHIPGTARHPELSKIDIETKKSQNERYKPTFI